MMIPVDICKIHPDAIIPEYKTYGSCAFDFASIEDATVAPGEIVRLRTGLVIKVPEGNTLLVVCRSSTPKKYGLCVPQGIGVIDQDYCGPSDEIHLQLLNFTKMPVIVHKGDRLAQGLLVPIVLATWNKIETVTNPDRGGFGSTG